MTSGHRYFAYGSNMNPERVRERGLKFDAVYGAALTGYRLCFDKAAKHHAGFGHANVVYAPECVVHGVVYDLTDAAQILRMDPFENAPINYGREAVQVVAQAGQINAWTYFANPAVRQGGLLPNQPYLDHLLAGAPYLPAEYVTWLGRWAQADPGSWCP